jgi:hypothetical protein
MKLKHLLMKTLFVAAGLCVGQSVWGENTTIGNVDQGWSDNKVEFTLPANKTLSLDFVVNSTKNTDNYQGWVTQVLHGTDMIFFMQPSCGYAVGAWNWDGNTHIYNENNYDWTGTNFRTNLQNASVAYSLKRVNSQFILTEDVTTFDNKHFRHYFVYADANAEDELKIVFGADAAQLTVTDVTPANVISDSEPLVLTGTLIGTLNNAKGGIKEQTFETFPLAANGSLTLHFKNYTNKLQIWNNFVVEITDDTHFLDLRGDGAGWQWAENWGEYTTWWNESSRIKTGYPSTDYEYMEAMDGADVVVVVRRTNSEFNIEATITPVSRSAFSETYSFTDDNLASSTVYVNLLCEGGHLDLLPVTKDISSFGWATFSSDYALDFSKATTGLEAYMITGHEGNVVKKSQVTGTVPAGTGLLLKGDAGSYNIPIVGSSTTDVSANLMKAGTGAAISAEGSKTKYVLGVSDNGTAVDTSDDFAEFQKITATSATVAKGKAYLQFNEVISARSLYFEDEVTGIANVEAAAETKANEGKFIDNGKLVIVKNGVKYNVAGAKLY